MVANEILNSLATLIAHNPSRVVVVVGAGVTLGALGGGPPQARATWKGLIEHGADWAARLAMLPPAQLDAIKAQLTSSDPHDMIAAAEKVTRALGGSEGGEFMRWMRDAVGTCHEHIRNREVLDELKRWSDMGVTFATTNYDSVLHEHLELPVATWKTSRLVERVLRGEQRAVLHLHGHWDEAGTVVFGTDSYEDVLSHSHARALLKSLRVLGTMVFIGMGAGIDDPNFGSLRKWAAKTLPESEARHYWIVDADAASRHAPGDLRDERTVPLTYAGGHHNLLPLLKSLSERSDAVGRAPKASPRDTANVLLLVNVWGEDAIVSSREVIEQQGGFRASKVFHASVRLSKSDTSDPREWFQVARAIDHLVDEAASAAKEVAPREVQFTVAGHAPLPVFAYLGHRSRGRLQGKLLLLNQRKDGIWDRIGPFRTINDAKNDSPTFEFQDIAPTGLNESAEKFAVFVDAGTGLSCDVENLSLVRGASSRLGALHKIESRDAQDPTPLDADSARRITDAVARAFETIRKGLPDATPVLAYVGPSWGAFWLGHRLKSTVHGSTEVPNYSATKCKYVPAMTLCEKNAPVLFAAPSILLFAAEPINDTRARAAAILTAIRSALESGGFSQVHTNGSLQYRDVAPDLEERKPQIVHILAHGAEDGRIGLEDADGDQHLVTAEDFVRSFRATSYRPVLAVFTICTSLALAKEMATVVDYTISAEVVLELDRAQAFSKCFYEQIGKGRSLKRAFEIANPSDLFALGQAPNTIDPAQVYFKRPQ